MKYYISHFCFLMGLLLCGIVSVAAESRMDSVLLLSRRANDYFMRTVPDPTANSVTDKVRPSHIWTRGVYYEGLMGLYEIDPQQRYIDYTDTWAESHDWSPRSTIWRIHADDQCCTQTYMTRYFQSGGASKYAGAKLDFDNQMRGRDRSVHNRDWTWIDAIQMAMPALAMLYRITDDRRYMEFAMQSYLWTRDSCGGSPLFIESEGLWWRDAALRGTKERDGKNSYWSRGNGWVYAALVRVMEQLKMMTPVREADMEEFYAPLQRDFLLMSKAIVECQREDGFWNASLVSSAYNGPELTGTGLFLYGLAWGLRNDMLTDPIYREAADRAWSACASCVHENGFLGYVQGTSDRPSKGWPFTYDGVPNFEDFGLGCFLLGTTEYYKLLKEQGETTGLTSAPACLQRQGEYYDLQGRRVKELKEGGIYIVNGKKIKAK